MEAQIPQPGELIAGKLLVEKVLGKGGMGVVLATTGEPSNDCVAKRAPPPGCVGNTWCA